MTAINLNEGTLGRVIEQAATELNTLYNVDASTQICALMLLAVERTPSTETRGAFRGMPILRVDKDAITAHEAIWMVLRSVVVNARKAGLSEAAIENTVLRAFGDVEK